MATHLAATSPAKGQPFNVQVHPTPKPGPDELLIAVKSVALNPADFQMRDNGVLIPEQAYPTVIGFDIAGVVLKVGENVPTTATSTGGGPYFQSGITRVAAYSASFWRSYRPAYGAFQERCLVPWQHAIPIPNSISFNRAAVLPVAVEVALNAWHVLGILPVPVGGGSSTSPSISNLSTTGMHTKKEALLIWGASSSVGTMGVQTARALMRQDADFSARFAAVYTTAGPANMNYVESLGADRVFNYKDPQVADAIVSAAKEDGLVIRHCFLATGELVQCQAVLSAFIEQDGEGEVGRIASAPAIRPNVEAVDGVETIFVFPAVGEVERLEQFRGWLGVWLGENLAKGFVKPSPEPTIMGKGLGAVNSGVDLLREGVSCTKLVVEVGEELAPN